MEIFLQMPVRLNDLNTEFNNLASTIIITGDDQIKEIEMGETCRTYGTEDEYLKSSGVEVKGMSLIASYFLRLGHACGFYT